MNIDELKEAIADHGIDYTLETCIELIDQGYLDPYYPQGDTLFVKRGLHKPLFYLKFMQKKFSPEEIETP
jgi:hypothetical protein